MYIEKFRELLSCRKNQMHSQYLNFKFMIEIAVWNDFLIKTYERSFVSEM